MASSGPEVFLCHAEMPEGPAQVFTFVPLGIVASRGLEAHGVIGALTRPLAPGEAVSPGTFARNSLFVEFLHAFLRANAPLDPAAKAQARSIGDGWVYIIDQRTPTPGGEVPPEDILGALQVARGEIIPNSYRRNEHHRILSERGFVWVGPSLHAQLVKAMAMPVAPS